MTDPHSHSLFAWVRSLRRWFGALVLVALLVG